MNIIYGALLLHSAGKKIDEQSIKHVAESTGEKVDETQIKALVAALDGVNIEEAIKKAAVVATAPVSEAKAEKKEEKEEDTAKKSEQAAEGLSALFN